MSCDSTFKNQENFPELMENLKQKKRLIASKNIELKKLLALHFVKCATFSRQECCVELFSRLLLIIMQVNLGLCTRRH